MIVSKAFRDGAESIEIIKPEEASLDELGPSQPLSFKLRGLIECAENAFTKLDVLLSMPSGQSRNWHTEAKKRWRVRLDQVGR